MEWTQDVQYNVCYVLNNKYCPPHFCILAQDFSSHILLFEWEINPPAGRWKRAIQIAKPIIPQPSQAPARSKDVILWCWSLLGESSAAVISNNFPWGPARQQLEKTAGYSVKCGAIKWDFFILIIFSIYRVKNREAQSRWGSSTHAVLGDKYFSDFIEKHPVAM